MTSWHSCPKIYNLGHTYIGDLFADPVIVEEKVDGSQFSFGVFDGQIKVRSKGQELIPDAPEKLFAVAVETVRALAECLQEGWMYRGEYLAKPKHNHNAYARVPVRNIIIFDVCPAEETYLPYWEKKEEAERIGLECVPLLHDGAVDSPEMFRRFLDRDSILGGCKIEGAVIKNYARFGPDKKVLMGKHVSEVFKEDQKKSWRAANPTNGDVLEVLAQRFGNEARWRKTVEHLRDAGRIEGSPKDIGALMKELQQDIEEECGPVIVAELLKWALPEIKRKVGRGFPEWYKQTLINAQFADGKAQPWIDPSESEGTIL